MFRMAQQFVIMTLLALTILGSFCTAGGVHHKHIIIHVPYHVKHHHHTHTIYKHIKHIDHGHDHHDQHHGHDDEWTFPETFDLSGGGWSGDYGSIGDFDGIHNGPIDTGSYENNNFGWDDK